MAGGSNNPHLKLRMSMSMYLYILLLISVSFFSIRVIGRVFSGTIALVSLLLWLAAGHFLFKPEGKKSTITLSYFDWPVIAFFIGIAGSFISAYLFYSQGLLASIVTTRSMLSLLMLPVLIAIKPSLESIRRTVWWFSITIFLVSVSDAVGLGIVDRELLLPEERLLRTDFIEEGSFVFLFPGFQFVAVSFFFELQALREKFSRSNLLRTAFLFFVIFVFQNRSMLFPCALVLLVSIISLDTGSKTRNKIIRVISMLMILMVFALTFRQWVSLFQETTSQLGDDSYNRVLALNHFLLEPPEDPVCYIIGSGFISAKTNTIMQDLMASGIYNSDVGFIGLWNYFGILPVLSLLAVMFRCLLGRRSSFALRCNAFLIIAGSMTITCFDGLNTIPWLCTVLYLWSVDYQR